MATFSGEPPMRASSHWPVGVAAGGKHIHQGFTATTMIMGSGSLARLRVIH
jgi:hypothetical protein